MDNAMKIPDCPVEMTLQLIGDKWKVLIIRDLLTGTKRFNEHRYTGARQMEIAP